MEYFVGSLGPFTLSAVAAITVIGLAMHVVWTRKSALLGPTLLTTLGIFFCFLGIAWGLLNFDPNDIKGSVPQLLLGIRTSFWSSVAGIGWALTIKLRVLLWRAPPPNSGEAAGATVDDLSDHLGRLNRIVSGPEESALLPQVSLLRRESSAGLDRLNASFERFAQRMVEENSRALIQALAEVVRDFNGRLNEQFGENFKKLNYAVEKLVIWQEQYKTQLDGLMARETAARNSVADSTLRFAEWLDKSRSFMEATHSLQEVIVSTKTHAERLDDSIRRASDVVERNFAHPDTPGRAFK